LFFRDCGLDFSETFKIRDSLFVFLRAFINFISLKNLIKGNYEQNPRHGYWQYINGR